MAAIVGTAYALSAGLTLNVKRRGNVAANQLAAELSAARLVLLACAPSLAAIAISFVSPWLAITVLSLELVVSMLQGWELEEETP